MVPVAHVARVEVGGECDVGGGHGGDRRCEDRDTHLAPEGGAAEAAGGGRGGELCGGGLDERSEDALGARAHAAGGVQLGQDEVHLFREGRLGVGGGVGGSRHLRIHKPSAIINFDESTW